MVIGSQKGKNDLQVTNAEIYSSSLCSCRNFADSLDFNRSNYDFLFLTMIFESFIQSQMP